VPQPNLLILSDADPMSDLDAARTFVERAGSTDKTVQTYAGYRHETLGYRFGCVVAA